MAVATACANIALVKYWGKRDAALNLPAAGSLSLTLDRLRTYTQVERIDGDTDELVLDGVQVDGKALARISKFVDLVRDTGAVRVTSLNTFPTAAGLASSASAFAALAVATAEAFDKALSPTELSVLARRGSGSAARSIFDGWAKMNAGVAEDGHDAAAEPVAIDLELCAAIAVANAGEKKIGSTEGMERTRTTSPYHEAWLATVERDLGAAIEVARSGDIERLAEIVEGNCLAMHADAMAARPGIIYFGPSTLWAIDQVRTMRAEGTPVFFTIDAGPHVVAFTTPDHVDTVAATLIEHPEVATVLVSKIGEGAHSIEAMP
ncbi:MAG: diphosphomevalonate decarboxylase [Deltaproteobacteria bacterium]